MYQEYAARHATVRALEVTPIDSPERLFVVDGVGVIDAALVGNHVPLAHPGIGAPGGNSLRMKVEELATTGRAA